MAKERVAPVEVEARLEHIEQRLDDIMEALTRVHVLVMVDTAIANNVEIPPEQIDKLRSMLDQWDQE